MYPQIKTKPPLHTPKLKLNSFGYPQNPFFPSVGFFILIKIIQTPCKLLRLRIADLNYLTVIVLAYLKSFEKYKKT
jgi:hypothetical protein